MRCYDIMKRYLIIISCYNQTYRNAWKKLMYVGRWRTSKYLQQIVIFNKSNDIQRPIAAILNCFLQQQTLILIPYWFKCNNSQGHVLFLRYNFFWGSQYLTCSTAHRPCDWLSFFSISCLALQRVARSFSIVELTHVHKFNIHARIHTRESTLGGKKRKTQRAER